MTKYIKISSIFLLISIATLFIREPAIFLFFKINDLFLLLSLIFLFVAIITREISLKQIKNLFIVLLFWLFALLIGTLLSFIIFKNLPINAVAQGYARFFACVSIFIEIIIISKYNDNFPKKILISFLFSLIIIPLIYIPSIRTYFIDIMNPRFSGFSDNSNFYAYFQLIPTMILLFYLIKGNQKKIIQILGFLIFCASIGTIIWSGSRSGLIGLLVSLIVILFFLLRSFNIKKVIIIIFLIFAAFPIGYFMLPSKAVNDIGSRVEIVLNVASVQQNKSNENSKIAVITANQSRLEIWKNSLYFIKKNPLGYGPGYDKIINVIGDGIGNNYASHNFELQALLTGGIALFICINLSLLYLVYKTKEILYSKNFNEIHLLISILAGILVSGLFIDAMDFRWTWVILALIVVYQRQPNPISLKK